MLAHTVVAEHQGQRPLQVGQMLISPGLEVRPIAGVGQGLQLRAGGYSWFKLIIAETSISNNGRQLSVPHLD